MIYAESSSETSVTNYQCWYDMIYLLTAIWLTPGGSSTVQYSTVQYSAIQYSTVQHTVTHKQYTEQHNETEYPERNIHNNKNT